MKTRLFPTLSLGLIAGLLHLLVSCAAPKPPASTGPFQAEYDASLKKPEVQVRNHAGRTVQLNAKGPENFLMSISAGETKSVSVTEGHYRFHASASGVVPLDGTADFQSRYRYVWTFYVR
ncbi:MAG: hypothetical protein H7A50_10445 [Akkermansiaceae bacterium]|nr:hypothetical protein [Akkermansiaceae bacterium]